MSASLIPLLLLVPILIAVALTDLSRLVIPNWMVLASIALFVVTVPIYAFDEFFLRLAAAMVVFAVLCVFFAFGLMGGGDVKMLPALVLFVPPAAWGDFSVILSFALVAGVVTITSMRSLTARTGPTGWLALDTPRAFPMGISIAFAGFALLALSAPSL